MRILLLSRYSRLGASSRIRSLQYLPFIESKGWQVDVNTLFSDSYLQALYRGQPRGMHVVEGYCRRLKTLLGVKKYDLIWIEKEMFPFVPAMAERLLTKSGVPYIVDFDDALFHRYDRHRRWFFRTFLGCKIDIVMKHAALVVAGNEYLAERAKSAGARRIEIVPSVVDLTRYKVVRSAINSPFIIGWIGTPKTSRYLSAIVPVVELLARVYDVQFVAVGANDEVLRGMPFKAWSWSEETEVQAIQVFDIGIMPLIDSPWESGKCGYKLIQYMACGVPVVASPVGVNKQIIEHGANGFLAHTLHEWEQAFRRLLNDHNLRLRMGDTGRGRVEKWYSLQIQAPRLEEIMGGVLMKHRSA